MNTFPSQKAKAVKTFRHRGKKWSKHRTLARWTIHSYGFWLLVFYDNIGQKRNPVRSWRWAIGFTEPGRGDATIRSSSETSQRKAMKAAKTTMARFTLRVLRDIGASR